MKISFSGSVPELTGSATFARADHAGREPRMRPAPPADLATAARPEITDLAGAARVRRKWKPVPELEAINPFGSCIASRVVARHHALELEGPHDATLGEAATMLVGMAEPIHRCRRHTMSSYEQARRAMTSLFGSKLGRVDCHLTSRADRKRSDPTWRGVLFDVDPTHLVDHDVGLRGFIFLRSLSTYFDRNATVNEWSPCPINWTQHAAERVLERTPNWKGNVHIALAHALYPLTPIIAIMSAAVQCVDDDAQVAIPFFGGLLYGSANLRPDGVALSNEVRGFLFDGRGTRYNAIDIMPTWQEHLSLHVMPSWTAITFIGPDNLRDNQRAYSAEFATVIRSSGLQLMRSLAFGRLAVPTAVHFDLRPTTGADLLANAAEIDAAMKGLDRDRLSRLAITALRTDVTKIRRLDRNHIERIPIRARDHDSDPMRRAQSMLLKRYPHLRPLSPRQRPVN